MFTVISHNEAETLAIGRVLGALLRAGDVVAIDGPLGAGKTRLVRGIAMGLGLDGTVVSSPTYVVVNEYEVGSAESAAGESGSGDEQDARATPRRLFHVDAYRLAGADDLDSLGWDRVMAPPSTTDAAVAIEWAERIAGFDALAGEEHAVCRVRMERVGGPDEESGGGRVVSIEPPPEWRGRPDAWRDLERLARVLRAPEPATGNVPSASEIGRMSLPRGWGRCPTTGKAVPPDAPTFPFADDRARLADLGKWMSGSYSISREIAPEDEEG